MVISRIEYYAQETIDSIMAGIMVIDGSDLVRVTRSNPTYACLSEPDIPFSNVIHEPIKLLAMYSTVFVSVT